MKTILKLKSQMIGVYYCFNDKMSVELQRLLHHTFAYDLSVVIFILSYKPTI